MSHTQHKLTYQLGDYTGDNWPLAQAIATTEDGDVISGWITMDKVHASQLEYGDFEDDLRLWSAAPRLLSALVAIVKDDMTDIRVSLLEQALDAIADATEEVDA